jgi:hypothetical protein
VDALVEAFLADRAGKAWARRTVPALRAWMEEDA